MIYAVSVSATYLDDNPAAFKYMMVLQSIQLEQLTYEAQAQKGLNFDVQQASKLGLDFNIAVKALSIM